ncbi:protein Smaug homolog 1-like [Lycorma delicatula]|uniref:protein Smaug homolog 1-like n=1 Tax=Lycorma delicatula TaxID=130591 RepID=UPI003F5184B9
MFQAQLNTMVTWLDQWNKSGQTVALFKLLTKLAPIQARFASIAIDYSLTDSTELALQEQEANNPGFVSGLLSESKEVAMTQLLLHLPLLRPGNQEAKHRYLAVVPIMLNYSMETGCFVEEARQLLVYVLIHPALKDNRRTFEPWCNSVGEKIMNGSKHTNCGVMGSSSNIGSSATGGGNCNVGTPGGGSPGICNLGNGSCKLQSHLNSQEKNRQHCNNFLTTPFGVTPSNELCTSQNDMSVVRDKSCRFSLSNQSCSPQLSPQSQITTGSNSEAQLDDLKLPHGYNSPGMKDVQAWLKSLRLHKYSKLFSQLTYEQMLSLSEETFDSVLEQIDAGPVTQGARRKVIRSIAKLRERHSNLCQLEQDVTNGGNLLNAMDMLKAVLVTPIKPATSDDDTSSSSGGNRQQTALDDIPAQFTKVLGKGTFCMQLIASDRADEEALSCFISILDKTYHHDCFTSQQKRKVSSWRLQFKQQLRQM